MLELVSSDPFAWPADAPAPLFFTDLAEAVRLIRFLAAGCTHDRETILYRWHVEFLADGFLASVPDQFEGETHFAESLDPCRLLEVIR